MLSFFNSDKIFTDKNILITKINNDGFTPFHLAIKTDNIKTVKMLIDKGFDINFKMDNPLKFAIQSGKSDISKILIHAGANVHVKDKFNRSMLQLALLKGLTDIASILIDKNIDLDNHDFDNETALNVAIKNGNIEIVEKMLKNGANIFFENKSGNLPLHISIQHNKIEITKLILDYTK